MIAYTQNITYTRNIFLMIGLCDVWIKKDQEIVDHELDLLLDNPLDSISFLFLQKIKRTVPFVVDFIEKWSAAGYTRTRHARPFDRLAWLRTINQTGD